MSGEWVNEGPLVSALLCRDELLERRFFEQIFYSRNVLELYEEVEVPLGVPHDIARTCKLAQA